MKILIVGSGAREHAIGHSLLKNPRVKKLYFSPGNAGTDLIGENVEIKATEIEALKKFAIEKEIDYTVVGPEDPLNLGIVDEFEKQGLKIFGPSKNAALLEGSKAFSKEFMERHHIPTAKYIKASDAKKAIEFASQLIAEYGKAVLKADGLCQGKGVYIAGSLEEAEKFIHQVFEQKVFGDTNLVVEEFVEGFELSLLCFVDNKSYKILPSARDYKNIYPHDLGPNTGGMGTYSPNFQGDRYIEAITKEILNPFLDGIQKENLDYRGLLFIGLMIGANGIKVLEFNTRFGDPETQSILQVLDTDLLELMEHTTAEKLQEIELKISDKKAVTLVLASEGYPGKYSVGKVISGLENVSSLVFHAGTKIENNQVVTSGGRVLSITDTGDTYEEANKKIMESVKNIHFDGMYYRYDIAPLVDRIYVEKKSEFDVHSKEVLQNLNQDLKLDIKKLRSFIRYDVQGLSPSELLSVLNTVFCEPPVDHIYVAQQALELEMNMQNPIVVEYHKGQFDQREQGVIDTIASTLEKEVLVNCARVYDFDPSLGKNEINTIKDALINPVDQVEGKLLGIPSRIDEDFSDDKVNLLMDGFIQLEDTQLKEFIEKWSLSMSFEDLKVVLDYFKSKDRNPSETEIRMLDTYWSDHCRHTTFNTQLQDIEFEKADSSLHQKIKETFDAYMIEKSLLRSNKPVTLMDMATIVAKGMVQSGELQDMEISEENNACSLRINVEIEKNDGSHVVEPYLLMFKNETHNHPTEIEPFGGASTCVGGAIRDPLSGRSYVYQAMRITGSGDPRFGMSKRIPGKLSQRKITTEAARGYSSYGNQIGLATGFVDELYHSGYIAKRMEVGAVIAAAPEPNVVRISPKPGDAILLLGGRTGRDGVGGATGSSKSHDEKSIDKSSAEVQKGNAPMERRLQRLFRNPQVSTLIKKCNDFGAGGVSVAIGELADSLEIWLEQIPLKYQGLSPMEIAISESQERMAVVIDPKNIERFIALSEKENLEATHVANVTDSGKLVMKYNNDVIVELDREFIDSGGAPRFQKVKVSPQKMVAQEGQKKIEDIYEVMGELNVASKKNLIENFDSTIGGNVVVSPLGGVNQITPAQAMVSEIPVFSGKSNTVSLMSYGFNPILSEKSPYLGAYYAVIESLSRLAASGANPLTARLSMQEYFEKLGKDPYKWEKPFVAMLGAYEATSILKTPPIGGKDSMSGTYMDLHVPPTLISFAVATEKREHIVTSELKGNGYLYLVHTPEKMDGTLDLEIYKQNIKALKRFVDAKMVSACASINIKGMLPTLIEMSFGNDVSFDVHIDENKAYKPLYGSFIVESKEQIKLGEQIGNSLLSQYPDVIVNQKSYDYQQLKNKYLHVFDEVFTGEKERQPKNQDQSITIKKTKYPKAKVQVENPFVVIPVFPGTNCEWDMQRAFEKAGAKTEILVFNNLRIEKIEESINQLAGSIKKANILALPGGFSLGDEPDGSGKFIANLLRNPKIHEAIEYMMDKNDGLIIGICNGFQALIKTGLLPFGKIQPMDEQSPTLTYNDNGRHIARMVSTVANPSTSPWMAYTNLEETYVVPVSHGEGRFVCNEKIYQELKENGQIAFRYIDNPNGSAYDIEAVTSPCGKILGKMGHSERVLKGLYKNIPEMVDAKIIQAGVDYFRK